MDILGFGLYQKEKEWQPDGVQVVSSAHDGWGKGAGGPSREGSYTGMYYCIFMISRWVCTKNEAAAWPGRSSLEKSFGPPEGHPVTLDSLRTLS